MFSIKFTLACILSALSLTFNVHAEDISTGKYSITQSWSQEKDYERPYFVQVPDGASGKLPVLIFLHGNGGNAERAMGGFKRKFPKIASSYILVFAQGYQASWNIVSERAKSNDLEFIEEIVRTLAKYDNVRDDDFTVMGSSNGAALANQIAIETDLAAIRNYVCLVSPLNGYQHDGKNFKVRGDDNNYEEVATPMTGKRLLNVSGENDPLVPYKGGPSRGIPAKDGKLPFVHAEESIFLWAKHFGYKGKKLTEPTSADDKLEVFSYLDGDVIHYKALGEAHGAGRVLNEQMLLDFLKGK